MQNPLEEYIIRHSSGLHCPALDWLEKQTHLRTNCARMLSGFVQGNFLSLLVKLSGAKRILEIGTFTGYSAICFAQAFTKDERGKPDGHIDTLDINDELEDLIVEGFNRAGVAENISLHIGDAKKTLLSFKQKLAESTCPNEEVPCKKTANALYDILYIDANKREYCEYYDLAFDLVRPGGLILADDVLWAGKVYQEPLPKDKQTEGILKFNLKVKNDLRVESLILPIRDGLNLIIKK